jgi:hypothetical protein
VIPVPALTRANEPILFDENCRQPGAAWLENNPGKDPHAVSHWWSQFRPDLARHFSHRCGWLGTTIVPAGDVDHWLSCGNRSCGPSPNRHLAFEWSNFRYAAQRINSRKGTLDDQILDPCEIEEGWFEILLPSFQLVPSDRLPASLRQRAKLTLAKLQLGRGEARFIRWHWYCIHWNNGQPDLTALRRDAPLVAVAIEKARLEGRPLPDPTECQPTHLVTLRRRPYAKRNRRIGGDNAG